MFLEKKSQPLFTAPRHGFPGTDPPGPHHGRGGVRRHGRRQEGLSHAPGTPSPVWVPRPLCATTGHRSGAPAPWQLCGRPPNCVHQATRRLVTTGYTAYPTRHRVCGCVLWALTFTLTNRKVLARCDVLGDIDWS